MDKIAVYLPVTVCFFSLLLSFFSVMKNSTDWMEEAAENSRPKYKLVVGIMSARNNFKERKAVRKSWLSLDKRKLEQLGIKLYFIVGDRDCDIPVKDRADAYSCEPWELLPAAGDQELPLFHVTARGNINFDKRQYGVHKLSFRVQYPFILSKLGLHYDSLGEKVQVKLIDAISETEIVKVVFTKENPGTTIDGYRYKAVEAYFLPAGFEGTVIVENMLTASGEVDTTPFDTEININNAGNSLLFLPNADLPKGHYHDSKAWNSSKIPLASLIYKVHDINKLHHLINEKENRISEYQAKLEKESNRLKKEMKKYQDIIAVNSTDVYRNLPRKVLSFYRWIVQNVDTEYILKTDDDCYVDLQLVISKLENWQNITKLWWGHFRHNWIVERYGKWAEADFSAPVYPKFACGAGYVFSKDLLLWLVENYDSLKLYQGEDVSMGIWMTAVGPNYIDDPWWQCEPDCISNMYAMPDTSPQELEAHWANLQACQDPCGCD